MILQTVENRDPIIIKTYIEKGVGYKQRMQLAQTIFGEFENYFDHQLSLIDIQFKSDPEKALFMTLPELVCISNSYFGQLAIYDYQLNVSQFITKKLQHYFSQISFEFLYDYISKCRMQLTIIQEQKSFIRRTIELLEICQCDDLSTYFFDG